MNDINRNRLVFGDGARGGYQLLLGSVEAGGTKFICGTGTVDGQVIDFVTIPTRNPDETLHDVIRYFVQHPVGAIGIASFGPLSLSSDDIGTITTTPKLAWRGVNIKRRLEEVLGIPAAIDTDVNASVLAERTWGAAQDLTSCVSMTVGTGIGAGIYAAGNVWRGITHPKLGHITVKRDAGDKFDGVCPSHGDCLEGLASGPALGHGWIRPVRKSPCVGSRIILFGAGACNHYLFIVSSANCVGRRGNEAVNLVAVAPAHVYPSTQQLSRLRGLC